MTKYRLLSGSAFIAFATGLSAPAWAGEIRGTVADATETGNLESAEVRIEELGRRTSTSGDGSYVFTEVPAGSYTVTASYVGAEPVSFTVAVPETGGVVRNFALGETGSTILVIGQSASQASALSRKRASDVVSDVLTRDSIGQFPDQNVAESLRRLPGINVLNDQGEGRFVSVRGLDPNLNATSLNGVRVPSPEGDIRGVALDVVSSEIIESIEVKKSLTPDMDADTIGASVEINTTSAFDRKSDLFVAKLGGSYNQYADALTPDVGFDFSKRLSENFGVSGGLSFYNREFHTDNVEADDWQEDNGLVYAEELEYRDYDVERERISATLGFDARLGENTELYLKGLWSQFDDQEFRRRLIFKNGDANVSGTSVNPVFDDTGALIEVERDLKDRFERQRIRTIVFGGESTFGAFNAEYSVSWAKSSELENRGSFDAVFLGEFEDQISVGFDYNDPRRPLYSVSGDTAAFFDPSSYALDEVELTALSDAEDEEYAAKFDLGYDFYTDAGTFTVQAGVKGRWREKTFNATIEFYEDDSISLAQFPGVQNTRITDIEPVSSQTEFRPFFESNIGSFEFQDIDSIVDSANEDYTAEEDIMASYLLGRWESDTLLVVGGVRYERTDTRLTGNQVNIFEEGQDLPDGSVADDDIVLTSSRTFERDYDHWLPSLNVRFSPQPDLVFRAAGYRSVVRPGLEQLAPRFEINEDDEAAIGNPDLEPFEAWNLDATVEYYMSNNGAITAGLFYKDVENYITGIVIDGQGSFQGVEFEEAETFINGPSAEVFGLEMGLYQQLSFLPEPFDGLLVQANYTYTDASGLIADGEIGAVGDTPAFREIPLPAASEHTFNGVLGYEKDGLSLRLAGTYRDGFLDEVEADGADFDRYVADHFQIDFSARYRITDSIQVYYEWVNINDAEFFAFNNLGGRENILQFEEYSWTMKGGVRLTF